MNQPAPWTRPALAGARSNTRSLPPRDPTSFRLLLPQRGRAHPSGCLAAPVAMVMAPERPCLPTPCTLERNSLAPAGHQQPRGQSLMPPSPLLSHPLTSYLSLSMSSLSLVLSSRKSH
ncbi:hypothetical protein D1007_37592 [Hordeum vulgare]|nr:hypothetical protein D1007_37592 [Hordeum vulgare]